MNKSLINLALLSLVGAAALTSCSGDDLYQEDQTLKEYEENFKTTFGNIDPEQDWSMATRGSVTVNVPTTSDVEIYGLVNGEYKCVGNFSKVSGTQTLEFDILKGCEDLMVMTKNKAFFAKVGEAIDFGSTRAMITSGNTSTVTVADANSEDTLSSTDAFVYQKKLPETIDNRNKEGVKKNFSVISDGETFTIYPIYWQTIQKLTLGVYYYDESKTKVEVPVYQIKDTQVSEARLLKKENTLTSTYLTFHKYNDEPNAQLREVAKLVSDASYSAGSLTNDEKASVIAALKNIYGSDIEVEDLKVKETWGQLYCVVKKYVLDSEWTCATGLTNSKASIDDSFSGELLSKGINVTINKSTKFGFYIKLGNGDTFYSQAELNPDDYYTTKDSQSSLVAGKKACHAAFYKADNGKTYLGFEDWEGYGSDMDLNDIIVRVDGINPNDDTKVVDEDKTNTSNSQSWIIACEDLGDTDDYDFNDVVLKVSHVSGETTATITPLAAGGTLATDVYVGNTKQGEIHAMISSDYANPTNGHYTILNTDGGANPGPGSSITINNVDKNFSLSASNGANSFGGISLKVHQTTDGTNSAKTITAPATGGVPQMFVVSGDWKWPKERRGIEKAYETFGTWVSNANSTEWQTNRNSEYIYGN